MIDDDERPTAKLTPIQIEVLLEGEGPEHSTAKLTPIQIEVLLEGERPEDAEDDSAGVDCRADAAPNDDDDDDRGLAPGTPRPLPPLPPLPPLERRALGTFPLQQLRSGRRVRMYDFKPLTRPDDSEGNQ